MFSEKLWLWFYLPRLALINYYEGQSCKLPCRVGLFVVKSDGLIDAQLLYIISDTEPVSTGDDDKDFVIINDETSFVMVASTMILSGLRILGQLMPH